MVGKGRSRRGWLRLLPHLRVGFHTARASTFVPLPLAETSPGWLDPVAALFGAY